MTAIHWLLLTAAIVIGWPAAALFITRRWERKYITLMPVDVPDGNGEHL